MDTPQIVTLVVRLALAGTFALAALGKLRDRDALGEAARAFGVGPRLVPIVAAILPIAELAVAVGLAVTSTAGWASVGAIALLAAFSALVGRALRLGRRPSCNCFGSGHQSPIGAATLVRNATLAALAVVVLLRWSVGGSADSLGPYGDLTTSQIAGLVMGVLVVGAVAVHSWLIANLLRQNGRLLERLEAVESGRPHNGRSSGAPRSSGLVHSHDRGPSTRPGPSIGSPAPRFALDDLDGRNVSIDVLLDDPRPQVLLFLEPGCPACEAMAAAINGHGSRDPERAIIGIVRGDRLAVSAVFDPAGFDSLLVDVGGIVAGRYGVNGTPSAIVVLPDGRVGSALAEGRAASNRLVRRDRPDHQQHDHQQHDHQQHNHQQHDRRHELQEALH